MEGLRQVYQQVKKDYGLSTTSLSFARILHFYIEPLYVISYVTSNDAALQLYQMELAEPGAGMDCYMEILDDEQIQFMAFLEEAGLESPFAAGRIQDVRETLEKALAQCSAEKHYSSTEKQCLLFVENMLQSTIHRSRRSFHEEQS